MKIRSSLSILAFNAPAYSKATTSKTLKHNQITMSQPTTTTTTTTTMTKRRMPVIYSSEFNKHRPPPGKSHPECPQRLDACVEAIKAHPELSKLIDWTQPPSITIEEEEEEEEEEGKGAKNREKVLEAIREVHINEEYIEKVRKISEKGGGGLDEDTYISPSTYEISLLSVSAWLHAIDITVRQKNKNKVAWALSRPPGHHATPIHGMGFCIFSNAAIAAKYAIKTYKHINHVGILDFDVHHGNGTQACIKHEKNIKFVSSHEFPLYPGSGPEGITGDFDNILNINLESGSGIEGYKERFENEMLPFLKQNDFDNIDLLIVSAGFDALDVDPLASLNFKVNDYKIFTQLIIKFFGINLPIIYGLEGGYNLGKNGLGDAVTQCIAGYCLPYS